MVSSDVVFLGSMLSQARHFLCSSRTFLVFQAGHGSKIARMAPILTIFWRNRSRWPDLVFENFSRRRRHFRVDEKFSRRTDEQRNERTKVSEKFPSGVSGFDPFISYSHMYILHLLSSILQKFVLRVLTLLQRMHMQSRIQMPWFS